jgi:Rrf2 family protein
VNTHFAVAVHILVYLAEKAGAPVSSEEVAGSVGTNASFVRRILAKLNSAGLATAQPGAGGGMTLGKPAREITLKDVSRAVDKKRELIPLHPSPHPQCPVGRNIKGALGETISELEDTVDSHLARTTIADVTAEVTRRERARSRGNP